MSKKRPDAKEIIAESAKASGVDPDRVYATLVYLVENDPNFRVIRANNSLFTIQNMGNGLAQIHLDTIDSPKELIGSIRDFLVSMKKAGFKIGSFESENEKIFKAIQMAGGKVTSKPAGHGKMIGSVEF